MKRNKMIWLGLGAAAVALLALASDRERKIVRVVKTWNPDYDILQVGSTPAFFTVFYSDGTEARIAANQRNDKLEAEVEKWIAEGGVIEEAGSPSVSGIGASPDDFTPEWTGYKGKDALKKIMKEKRGVCRNAYEVDGVSVDIIWGKVTDRMLHKGYGLSHIEDKHKVELQAKGFDFVDIADMCLKNGILNAEKSDTKSRRYDYGKSCAVVALDEKNDSVWLLTGYFNL